MFDDGKAALEALDLDGEEVSNFVYVLTLWTQSFNMHRMLTLRKTAKSHFSNFLPNYYR